MDAVPVAVQDAPAVAVPVSDAVLEGLGHGCDGVEDNLCRFVGCSTLFLMQMLRSATGRRWGVQMQKFPFSSIWQWTQSQIWKGSVLVQDYGVAVLKLVESLSNGCMAL